MEQSEKGKELATSSSTSTDGGAASATIGGMSEDQIVEVVKGLRAAFDSERTLPYDWRIEQLKQIVALINENQEQIFEALRLDLGKSKTEALLSEVNMALQEAQQSLDELHQWMKPRQVSVPLAQMKGMSSAMIQPQPLGVVLIISPWNYPFNLCMNPIIGAVAAGNCVLLKPSEIAVHTSNLLAELIPKYLDTDCIAVVEGAVPETTALLKQRFDHIFYTGNGTVGKIVMRAASNFLTPVTLELGGKSPCIVDKHVDFDVAARRIIWGKFVNCGQTCIAPDYVLVHEEVAESFIDRLKEQIKHFYTDDPKTSGDYGRIISSRHLQRLVGLLKGVPDDAVVAGGASTADEEDRFLAPTLVLATSLPDDNKLLEEEIFGPILPIVTVPDIDAAIRIVNSKPKPLALYLFSSSKASQEQIMQRTTSGGCCINETLMHFACPALPFGGVGESGMGAYHGRYSFETFSHHRAVLNKTTWFDLDVRYPPYTENKVWMLKKML